MLRQGSTFQGDQADDNDIFGDAVISGDFDNDGNDDIAIGAPEESLNDLVLPSPTLISKSGMFHIVYGDSTWASIGTNFDVFTEESGGALSTALANSRLGCDLSVGNFNGDAYADLAVCADGRRVGTINNAGSVYVLRGSAAGITTTSSQIWNFAIGRVCAGDAFGGDNFGDSMAAGDYNNDGRDDLAIAVDKREIAGSPGIDHGLTIVLPGSQRGGPVRQRRQVQGLQRGHQGHRQQPGQRRRVRIAAALGRLQRRRLHRPLRRGRGRDGQRPRQRRRRLPAEGPHRWPDVERLEALHAGLVEDRRPVGGERLLRRYLIRTAPSR